MFGHGSPATDLLDISVLRTFNSSRRIAPLRSLDSHCCYLLAAAVPFGFLMWTNDKASFGWPATVGAKICGIRELKTTIQTIFCHICPPYLSSAIVWGRYPGPGNIPRYHLPLVLPGSLPLTKSIEDISHCYITATRCTVTMTSHLLFAFCGCISESSSPLSKPNSSTTISETEISLKLRQKDRICQKSLV